MTRAEVLQAAEKCVCGDRDEQYGNPEDSFTVIADLWGAYRDEHYKPHDVAMMLALMKIARIVTGVQKEDSYVDAAGYLACAGEIATRKPPNALEKVSGAMDAFNKHIAEIKERLYARSQENAMCETCTFFHRDDSTCGLHMKDGHVIPLDSCLEWERKIGE